MSEIILPFSEEEKSEQKELQVNYEATQDDEEKFFLMYHMSFQPSEVNALDPEYRRWLMARFMMQKNMEREAMVQQRMMQQLGSSIKA